MTILNGRANGVIKDGTGMIPDAYLFNAFPLALSDSMTLEDTANQWGANVTTALNARNASNHELFVTDKGYSWGAAAERMALGRYYHDYKILREIFDGITLAQIAAAIGVSAGTHYRYSGSVPNNHIGRWLEKKGFSMEPLEVYSQPLVQGTYDASQMGSPDAWTSNFYSGTGAQNAEISFHYAQVPPDECWIWFLDRVGSGYGGCGYTRLKFKREGALAGIVAVLITNATFNTGAGTVMYPHAIRCDEACPDELNMVSSTYSNAQSLVTVDEANEVPSNKWYQYDLDPLGHSGITPKTGGMRRLGIRKYPLTVFDGFPQGVGMSYYGAYTIAGRLDSDDLTITMGSGFRGVEWPGSFVRQMATDEENASTDITVPPSDLTSMDTMRILSYVPPTQITIPPNVHRLTEIGREVGGDLDGEVMIEADTEKSLEQHTFQQAADKCSGKVLGSLHMTYRDGMFRPSAGSVKVSGAIGAYTIEHKDPYNAIIYSGSLLDMTVDQKLALVDEYYAGGNIYEDISLGYNASQLIQLVTGLTEEELGEMASESEASNHFREDSLLYWHGHPATYSPEMNAAIQLCQGVMPRDSLMQVFASMIAYARAAQRRLRRTVS